MTQKKKEEGSTTAGIVGFSAPFGRVVRRKTDKKPNPSAPYECAIKESEDFEDDVVASELNEEDMAEIVRKRGNQWVYFDDDDPAKQLGVYSKRSDAWKKQRQMRSIRAAQKKAKKVAKQAQTARKKEAVMRTLTDRIKTLLKESNIFSYMFEQTPMSNDSLTWERFIEKLPQQTIMSDSHLKDILRKEIKVEVKLLVDAVEQIRKVLEGTKSFEVTRKNAEKDERGDIALNFEIHMKENNKKVKLSVKIDNARPVIVFNPETKHVINSLANDESKLLVAELMHVQETVLDNMDDIANIREKRNSYLRNMEKKTDSVLSKLNALQINMLKSLLKNKYKGV